MNLIFATSNEHKAREAREILGNRFTLLTLKDLGYAEDIPETGLTLSENAAIKSAFVVSHFGKSCFADDSGLEVKALNGQPGVFSARYAGIPANDMNNNMLLLENLKDSRDRSARFVTIISFRDGDREFLFEGEMRGRIAANMKGSNGFGYDPIFIPEGYDQTLAELSAAEKNRISHRAKALRRLSEFLQKNF